MSATPHIPNQDAPAPARFQIASRLGSMRDTAQITDPLGTGAVFTIRRSGSTSHKAWFKNQVANDPMTRLMAESMLETEPVVLTQDETEIVNGERAKSSDTSTTPNPLLPVVDRIVLATSERLLRRDALKRLMESGKISLMDMAAMAGGRHEEDRLEEALFLLKGWQRMPDADGADIPYSPELARELLTNDTPLEGAGVDDLVLQVDAWVIKLDAVAATDTTEAVPARRIIIPGLTLGLAYQLLILTRARDTASFRDKVIEAGAKNSVPSSDSISSSGDGASSEAPAS